MSREYKSEHQIVSEVLRVCSWADQVSAQLLGAAGKALRSELRRAGRNVLFGVYFNPFDRSELVRYVLSQRGLVIETMTPIQYAEWRILAITPISGADRAAVTKELSRHLRELKRHGYEYSPFTHFEVDEVIPFLESRLTKRNERKHTGNPDGIILKRST